MANTVADKSTIEIPEEFVEHTRPITNHSIAVRKAIASGELNVRPRRKRKKLSAEEAKTEAEATRNALKIDT